MLLGCIGDDFTGSSDLANTLAKQGMRTVQYAGVPTTDAPKQMEAAVVALKSRSIAAALAVQQSLQALEWLQAQGCEQFFFKYCSTFDSTPQGNIGPVTQALGQALDASPIVVCPAFPGTGRTVYMGHLFVNGQLLNECGMQDHPLTPMTDADLRRWLQPQTSLQVGHVEVQQVHAGVEATRAAFDAQHKQGKSLLVVDAINDNDLKTIGSAASQLRLITGGSGVALGLPDNFRRSGKLSNTSRSWRGQPGRCAILSGSCSTTTREQLALYKTQNPALEISAADVISGHTHATQTAAWVLEQSGAPVVYSSARPDVVARVQQQFGRQQSATALEQFFAQLAALVVAGGVTRLIVAGGETSGAVVEGLNISAMEIGPEIDPGVPAMRADDALVIAMKSGNFGAEDFFVKAATIMATDA